MSKKIIIQAQVKHRILPQNEWETINPILKEGEIGFLKDTTKYKVGDGNTQWNELNYSDKPLNDFLNTQVFKQGQYSNEMLDLEVEYLYKGQDPKEVTFDIDLGGGLMPLPFFLIPVFLRETPDQDLLDLEGQAPFGAFSNPIKDLNFTLIQRPPDFEDYQIKPYDDEEHSIDNGQEVFYISTLDGDYKVVNYLLGSDGSINNISIKNIATKEELDAELDPIKEDITELQNLSYEEVESLPLMSEAIDGRTYRAPEIVFTEEKGIRYNINDELGIIPIWDWDGATRVEVSGTHYYSLISEEGLFGGEGGIPNEVESFTTNIKWQVSGDLGYLENVLFAKKEDTGNVKVYESEEITVPIYQSELTFKIMIINDGETESTFTEFTDNVGSSSVRYISNNSQLKIELTSDNYAEPKEVTPFLFRRNSTTLPSISESELLDLGNAHIFTTNYNSLLPIPQNYKENIEVTIQYIKNNIIGTFKAELMEIPYLQIPVPISSPYNFARVWVYAGGQVPEGITLFEIYIVSHYDNGALLKAFNKSQIGFVIEPNPDIGDMRIISMDSYFTTDDFTGVDKANLDKLVEDFKMSETPVRSVSSLPPQPEMQHIYFDINNNKYNWIPPKITSITGQPITYNTTSYLQTINNSFGTLPESIIFEVTIDGNSFTHRFAKTVFDDVIAYCSESFNNEHGIIFLFAPNYHLDFIDNHLVKGAFGDDKATFIVMPLVEGITNISVSHDDSPRELIFDMITTPRLIFPQIIVSANYHNVSWVEENGFHTLTIPVSGIEKDLDYFIDVDTSELSTLEQVESAIAEYNKVVKIVAQDNALKIYAREQPQTSFKIKMKVI